MSNPPSNFVKPSTLPSSLSPRQTAPRKTRPRAYSRPPPIVVLSPKHLNAALLFKSPSPKIPTSGSRPKSPVEPLDSPAFLKGDLNFSTFRERAARAIAEWGPSPTGAHFPANDARLLTPRRNQAGPSHSNQIASQGLRVPSNAGHQSAVASHFSSPPLTPVTPLTPGPCSRPQHREKSPVNRRPSLKRSTRPRPSPLQLNKDSHQDYRGEIENMRNVRFAEGSPLRGSTWHITQYPARLASPPISAANLSLADLIELEAIKQSLGTWCGEMMGSPMRGSFSQSSTSSASESDGSKSWAPSHTPWTNSESFTSSPTSRPEDIDEDIWGAVQWPDSPAYDSDCDSEIFEGMH